MHSFKQQQTLASSLSLRGCVARKVVILLVASNDDLIELGQWQVLTGALTRVFIVGRQANRSNKNKRDALIYGGWTFRPAIIGPCY